MNDGTIVAILLGIFLAVVSCFVIGLLDYRAKRRREEGEALQQWRTERKREALAAGYEDEHEYMWAKMADLESRRPDRAIRLRGLG